MNRKKIGKRISEKRKIKNLTQQELANKLNITNRTIINWENGKCLPDYSILLLLCNELDISINELLTGETSKEQKTNATIELILEYLDRNRNDNLKEYNKVGKIFLIGGILLTIIGVQIPLDQIWPKFFLDSLLSLYPIIGIVFSFIGLKFINKKYHFKKRFLLNFIFIICNVIFLVITDIISVKFYNRLPRYHTNEIYNPPENEIVYIETIFYDAYACNDFKLKLIPASSKRYKESDAKKLGEKYCSSVEIINGGEEE